MYTYNFKCNQCGTNFCETREQPYKSVVTKKKCPECRKDKSRGRGIKFSDDLAGMTSDERCENCIHFGAKSMLDANKFWKGCAMGYISLEAPELEMVYFLDTCLDFKGTDEDH